MDSPGAVQTSAELDEALRTGPLHVALDLAIHRSRITLEALQRRLGERGVHVGVSTLSYWRRGHRHPEGPRSMQALHALESVLELPHGSLTTLSMATDDHGWHRGGIRRAPALDLDRSLGLTEEHRASLAGIDLEANLRLTIHHLSYFVEVDEELAERRVTATCAVSSRVDGVDRYTVLYETRSQGSVPVLALPRSCRVGRVRQDPDRGLLAADLRFDYPLRAGDTYVFGFRIDITGSAMTTGYFEHGFREAGSQLLIQIGFAQAAIPVACYRYYRNGQEPDESARAELPIGGSATVHSLVLDAEPGVHGVRWEWQ